MPSTSLLEFSDYHILARGDTLQLEGQSRLGPGLWELSGLMRISRNLFFFREVAGDSRAQSHSTHPSGSCYMMVLLLVLRKWWETPLVPPLDNYKQDRNDKKGSSGGCGVCRRRSARWGKNVPPSEGRNCTASPVENVVCLEKVQDGCSTEGNEAPELGQTFLSWKVTHMSPGFKQVSAKTSILSSLALRGAGGRLLPLLGPCRGIVETTCLLSRLCLPGPVPPSCPLASQ